MSIRPKGLRGYIILALCVLLICAAAYLSGLSSTRSAARIAFSSRETAERWSAGYALLNGTMQKRIYPPGSADTLVISVETESGSLAVTVTDDSGAVLLQEDFAESASASASVSGPVTVRLDARSHKGSFDISAP